MGLLWGWFDHKSEWDECPYKGDPRELSHVFCHRQTPRRLWTRKQALPSHWICGSLSLRLPASRTVKIIFVVYKLPVYGIVLQQPEWTEVRWKGCIALCLACLVLRDIGGFSNECLWPQNAYSWRMATGAQPYRGALQSTSRCLMNFHRYFQLVFNQVYLNLPSYLPANLPLPLLMKSVKFSFLCQDATKTWQDIIWFACLALRMTRRTYPCISWGLYSFFCCIPCLFFSWFYLFSLLDLLISLNMKGVSIRGFNQESFIWQNSPSEVREKWRHDQINKS